MNTTTTTRRCRTCKFWDAAANFSGGTCERMKSSGGAADFPDSLAVAHDGEDYVADVVTSPDFGCVMHVFKVQPDPDVDHDHFDRACPTCGQTCKQGCCATL